MRVLLLDSHIRVRHALARWLQATTDIDVVGGAASRRQGVELALAVRPDVVVMELRFPDGSGIEACQELRMQLPELRVIFLTSSLDPSDCRLALDAGAKACLLKQLETGPLLDAIRGDGHNA